MRTGRPSGISLHLFLVHLICQISAESTDFAFEDCQTTNQYFLSTVCEDCHDSRSCLTMLSISCKKTSLICQVNPHLWWTVLKEL